ncbi:MAG TPA: M48 family metalloprotease [Symbiobacteriaceae bacterium]|nr:M48 family metalloprotease [Symbiobacteriaceae bacterium]
MEREASPALRRCWLLLWLLAVAGICLLLFAVLRDRPYDDLALQHFSREVLARGRQFSREARIAGTARDLAALGAMLWLCFHRTGARLTVRLERLGRGRLWLGLIAVAAGMTLLLALVRLPFSFYLGYWHERAYDLTRQRPAQWLAEYLQGVGLQMAVTLLLWLPLYWLIRHWPRGWWAPAALLNVTLTGLLVVASPLLFLPMQGKVVQVTDPRLVGMVERIANQAGLEVAEVRELKVSDRTSRVNAMVTGLGKTRQVVFFDTLLAGFKPDEVEVVVAHEMAHAIHQDVATGWLLDGLLETGTLLAAAWMLRTMVGVGPLRMANPHAARGLALLMLFTTLVGEVTGPLHNAVSRQMEVRADRFALETTRNPDAFIRTFKKLAAGNVADVDPPALVELLSATHPSIINRIRAAETQ